MWLQTGLGKEDYCYKKDGFGFTAANFTTLHLCPKFTPACILDFNFVFIILTICPQLEIPKKIVGKMKTGKKSFPYRSNPLSSSWVRSDIFYVDGSLPLILPFQCLLILFKTASFFVVIASSGRATGLWFPLAGKAQVSVATFDVSCTTNDYRGAPLCGSHDTESHFTTAVRHI